MRQAVGTMKPSIELLSQEKFGGKNQMKTKLTLILLTSIFLLLACNDGIKQRVSHKQVGDELHYTVMTTWTDSLGNHTIIESYLDRDSAYKIKQQQLKTAKEVMKQNNEQASTH